MFSRQEQRHVPSRKRASASPADEHGGKFQENPDTLLYPCFTFWRPPLSRPRLRNEQIAKRNHTAVPLTAHVSFMDRIIAIQERPVTKRVRTRILNGSVVCFECERGSCRVLVVCRPRFAPWTYTCFHSWDPNFNVLQSQGGLGCLHENIVQWHYARCS